MISFVIIFFKTMVKQGNTGKRDIFSRISSLMVSSKTMTLLLLILAISIGTATFIENSYNTTTAKVLIYNARWFELVLILLVINFVGNIGRYNLLSLKKIIPLTFHLAFILVIIGAGITRYIGFEGTMRIPEGEMSNVIYSADPYLQIFISDSSNPDKGKRLSQKMFLTEITDNHFEYRLDYPGVGEVKISYVDYLWKVKESFESGFSDGEKMLELVFSGKEKKYIKSGETMVINGLKVAFETVAQSDAICFNQVDSGITVIAPFQMLHNNMSRLSVEDRTRTDLAMDTLWPDSTVLIRPGELFFTKTGPVAVREIHEGAKMVYKRHDNGLDVLKLSIEKNGKSTVVDVIGGMSALPNLQVLKLDQLIFSLSYGPRLISLPFHIRCNNFTLDKYPGSDSPSSFESEITLIDGANQKEEDHKIFMNNVLDYKGYRFFQSSYDWSDQAREQGLDPDITSLSVNHDYWGTLVTYIGYFFLFACLLLQLFNPNSRFLELRKKVIKLRVQRKTLTGVFLLLALNGISQVKEVKIIPLQEAEKLGQLIVQHQGRYQPVHTLAYDIMHKLARKDKFELDGYGTIDAMQVYADIPVNTAFWVHQKIIKINPKTGIGKLIGCTEKYVAIEDFRDTSFKERFVLKKDFEDAVITANAKKPTEKTVLDKELIIVNERLNIFFNVLYGYYLKVFPVIGSESSQWIGMGDSLAYQKINPNELEGTTYNKILLSYRASLMKASQSGDYSESDETLKLIGFIQRAGADQEDLPGEAKLLREINYNKNNIFKSTERTYAFLSVFLLIFALIQNLRVKNSKVVGILLWIFIGLTVLAFCYHTYGLALRWHITGHAPWSNGYEALIFIAWGSLLAGFIFSFSSKITLGATALLAFFIMMTAGHSSMDPQLSNLVPVLKSYWLVIHVACITISYGFFGLGFIVGLINLFLTIFKTKRNDKRVDSTLLELTYINEMTCTVGVVLATIGTFLGGIWANESWGRYWGWDAKETWALVIVIIYSILLHLRFVPGLRGKLMFNSYAVLAFGSVLMTYFGVNYFLGNSIHSYARGDSFAFPVWIWFTIFSILLIVLIAALRNRLSNKISEQFESDT